MKHADGTTWYRKHLFRALWALATRAVTVFGLFDSGTADALRAWTAIDRYRRYVIDQRELRRISLNPSF